MTKISSSMTVFYKKVFPILWFGALVPNFIYQLINPVESYDLPISPAELFFSMIVFGYLLMKFLTFDLVDQVFDKGNNLVIINSGKEIDVPIKSIENISVQMFTNPERATIHTNINTPLGKKIVFMPLTSLIPFKKNKTLQNLIERVNEKK